MKTPEEWAEECKDDPAVACDKPGCISFVYHYRHLFAEAQAEARAEALREAQVAILSIECVDPRDHATARMYAEAIDALARRTS